MTSATYAYIEEWNRKLQCFPVRITRGYQNLQWMSQAEIDAVTVEYRTDINHRAQVKQYVRDIGAVPANY